MWRTSSGDRTLKGSEAQLFLLGVGHLREMIMAGVELESAHQTSVELFDRLQPTQQLSVLHEVAFALLSDDVDPPELTAIREATVYVIYCELDELVEVEIQHFLRSPGTCPDRLRQLIVDAAEQVNQANDEWYDELPCLVEVPQFESVDTQDWHNVIEDLVNLILWDRDFELEALFADHDPALVRETKEYLGISDIYFSVPAPDPKSAEFRRLDQELVELSQI